MRNVMALRDQRQKAIAEHPFFEWLHSDRTPLEERLMFAPMGAFFIMQFSDMNRWVLRFPESTDEFRWVITPGTYKTRRTSGWSLRRCTGSGLADNRARGPAAPRCG